MAIAITGAIVATSDRRDGKRDQAVTPSQRSLALLGRQLVTYLVIDAILDANGFPLPDSRRRGELKGSIARRPCHIAVDVADMESAVKAGCTQT